MHVGLKADADMLRWTAVTLILVSIAGCGGQIVAPPPPPQPSPQRPVRVGSIISTLHKIHDVAPVYPVAAIEAHVEGVVIVEARIDTDGRVTEVKILRSIPLLDMPALEAVRQWQFEPVAIDGLGVIPTIVALSVRFELPKQG
jgi:TonB family protein